MPLFPGNPKFPLLPLGGVSVWGGFSVLVALSLLWQCCLVVRVALGWICPSPCGAGDYPLGLLWVIGAHARDALSLLDEK